MLITTLCARSNAMCARQSRHHNLPFRSERYVLQIRTEFSEPKRSLASSHTIYIRSIESVQAIEHNFVFAFYRNMRLIHFERDVSNKHKHLRTISCSLLIRLFVHEVHGIESQFYWLNMTRHNEFQFVWRSSFVYSNRLEKIKKQKVCARAQTVDADTLLIKRHGNEKKKKPYIYIYWIAFKQLKLQLDMNVEKAPFFAVARLLALALNGDCFGASWKAMFERAVNRHHDNKTRKTQFIWSTKSIVNFR